MIIAKIQGGLGNQLFQYAFAKKAAQLNGVPLKLDLSFYQNGNRNAIPREFLLGQLLRGSFDIAGRSDFKKIFGNEWIVKLAELGSKAGFQFHPAFIKEKREFSYDSNIFIARKKGYYTGYWQSFKYFEDTRKALIHDLIPGDNIALILQNFERRTAIALHVRRGDYTQHSRHILLDKNYYLQAINQLLTQLPMDHHRVFWVFSDDIEWCIKNFDGNIMNCKFEFVNEGTDIEQFLLMTQCAHFILANSSYSWWAAWLANNPFKKVVAPANWIRDHRFKQEDFFPEDWLII